MASRPRVRLGLQFEDLLPPVGRLRSELGSTLGAKPLKNPLLALDRSA
jgi:hypothetical protein